MSDEPVSIEALAEAVREPVEQIRHWQGLGLLGGEGSSLTSDAIERARLVSFAVRRGIAAEAIAEQSEDVIGRFIELTGRQRGEVYTVEEAAKVVGLDPDTVRRLRLASGRGDQSDADEDDMEMLRGLAFALRAGMPLEALLQLARVFNDALTRVAEAETRLFHFYVHERLRADGLTGAELDAATDSVSASLQGLAEPALLYFHRKAWQQALLEDLVLHLAEDVAATGDVGRLAVAVLFVDLAGFTPMTESMGDAAAAAVVERFSDLVREAAGECDGRVLKQIGDEFMLVFPSASQVVACGRSIMAKTAIEEQFPDLRLGAHAGTALYREGDYLGATVNVAARVASEATRGQFLVTGAVRDLLGSGASTESVGLRALKGVSAELELFEVQAQRAVRPIDPVCGMLIDPRSSAVTLDWHGTRRFFCSDGCCERFLADPTRYAHL